MSSSLSLVARRLATFAVCLSLPLLAARPGLAQERGAAPSWRQSGGPASRMHHVEALVGGALSGQSETTADIVYDCLGPCPPPPPDRYPRSGGGPGVRIGYRLRLVSFFEIGVSGEADFSETRTLSAPLMAYLHLATEEGSSLTLGFGGGVSQVRLADQRQTFGIVRAELGGAIPVSAKWSIAVLAHLTASARGLRANERLLDTGDRNPEWIGLSLGPRYSF